MGECFKRVKKKLRKEQGSVSLVGPFILIVVTIIIYIIILIIFF